MWHAMQFRFQSKRMRCDWMQWKCLLTLKFMHFANFAHRTPKPKLTNSTGHLTTNDASNFFWFPDNHLLNFWKGRDAVAIGFLSGRRWLVNHVNYNKSVTYSTFCNTKKKVKKNTKVVGKKKQKKTKGGKTQEKARSECSGSVHLMKMMTMPRDDDDGDA